MLLHNPLKGDLVKLPQGTITYRNSNENEKDEMGLVFAEEIMKPAIGIFLENLNERVCKLIIEDKIRYAYSEWLFNLEESDASQTYDNTRRNCQL